MSFKLPDIKLPPMNNPLSGLGKKSNLSLGLDIGSHAIKICELSQAGGKYNLISLGSSLMPPGAVEDGVLQDSESVAKIITSLIKNLKIKGKKVAISISGYSVIVKKISLSVMSEEDLESHIHSEAEQYIPFDIDDVYLDFQDLKTNKEDEERTDVMLVAAKKEVVDDYLDMLKQAGLTAVVVDVDAFALENAYEDNFGLEGNFALIDIGASKMNINILSEGTSILARDVALGSRQLTEQIQTKFDISFEEAEAIKVGQVEPGDKQGELEDIFVSTCTQWITEIKRALDFYASNYPDKELSKLVLSGGGARIKGIEKFFQAETNIPVELFNPFAKVSFSEKNIDSQYIQYIAPEMAISVGLATRTVEL